MLFRNRKVKFVVVISRDGSVTGGCDPAYQDHVPSFVQVCLTGEIPPIVPVSVTFSSNMGSKVENGNRLDYSYPPFKWFILDTEISFI